MTTYTKTRTGYLAEIAAKNGKILRVDVRKTSVPNYSSGRAATRVEWVAEFGSSVGRGATRAAALAGAIAALRAKGVVA